VSGEGVADDLPPSSRCRSREIERKLIEAFSGKDGLQRVP
jgi:hypothetical protein